MSIVTSEYFQNPPLLTSSNFRSWLQAITISLLDNCSSFLTGLPAPILTPSAAFSPLNKQCNSFQTYAKTCPYSIISKGFPIPLESRAAPWISSPTSLPLPSLLASHALPRIRVLLFPLPGMQTDTYLTKQLPRSPSVTLHPVLRFIFLLRTHLLCIIYVFVGQLSPYLNVSCRRVRTLLHSLLYPWYLERYWAH